MSKMVSIIYNNKRKCQKSINKFLQMTDFISKIPLIKYTELGTNQSIIPFIINATGYVDMLIIANENYKQNTSSKSKSINLNINNEITNSDNTIHDKLLKIKTYVENLYNFS